MKEREDIKALQQRLDQVPARDAARFARQLRRLSGQLSGGKPAGPALDKLRQRIEVAEQRVEQRRAARPRLEFDDALPITAHRDEIVAALQQHPVLIIAGETGSGKTTQLPKLCLAAERGTRGQVACTQPRRIAASAMAQRVAEELHCELGQTVGYQVRFRERFSPDSLIKFMTDGILLAETIRDPDLLAYDTIIIDEAHERSLNIDFLLGYLKLLLRRRKDLKVVITSATIDTAKFSRHFDNAPVIEVSGRGYPVEVVYQPFDSADDSDAPRDRDIYQGIADAVRRLDRTDSHGDILVFLSGEREIREAGEFLSRQRLPHTEILPLYARLSAAEQRRVFHPGPLRRIILSTNVAETSLTVPRIRSVIDSGLARISRYAHRSRTQRLPIEPVSQASANQRAGRCGRLGPGTCIRLYSEADFLGRPEFTEPEILRTSLGSVILRMLVMGLGAVEEFPFIDAPAPRMINDAYSLLQELGAIDERRRPTPLGRQMDGWPVDVRLARMLAAGDELACLQDLMVLVAALSIQDPRERPLEAQQAADEKHQRFADDKSDFTALLKLWAYLRQQRKSVSGNQFRKLCGREFLNWQRVLEWFDLYQQLRDQARESGLQLAAQHGSYETMHQALLSGLLSHVGLKHPEDRSYQGARSRSFHIFPGSGLFKSTPKWIMAAEIVETGKAWGRTNAVIQPEWIEQRGAHLLKRHYSDPHWSRRRGAVFAWEQVSLFGLVVVERRRVAYAPIDAVEARRLFILEALVRGELDTRASFVSHNEQVREEVEALEHKRRKRDVLADEHAQFEFFDARIPQQVSDARAFERWLQDIGREGRKQLRLGHDVLMREDAAETPADQFPDHFECNGQRFPLSYHFEPGHEHDGVSLRVPLEQLNTLDAGALQWLVPGLLRDKVIALIRALPKPVRRALTPVPEFADAVLNALGGQANEPLLDAMARELNRMTGLSLQASDLDENAIAAHFRFRIVVCADSADDSTAGLDEPRVLDSGRDLLALQSRHGQAAQRSFMDQQGQGVNRDGATHWAFGQLQTEVRTAAGVAAWPALVDQQTAVGLRLFDTELDARLNHAEGVMRLLALTLADKLAYLRKHSGLDRAAVLAWSAIDSHQTLVDDLAWSSLTSVAGDVQVVRDEAAFEQLAGRVRSQVGRDCQRQAKLLNDILPLQSRLTAALDGEVAERWPLAAEDMSLQLQDLLYPGFLADLQAGRLAHYPRYLAAIEERLLQLPQNPARDQQRMNAVNPWWGRYLERLEQGEVYDEALDEYRWLIEEYRVSQFAQRLGTAEKVSPKRLDGAWKKVLKSS